MRRQPGESFWRRKTSSRTENRSLTAERDPVRDVSPARPAEITVPGAPREWRLRGGDTRSLGTCRRPCSPPGSSHLPGGSLSLTPRPPPRGGPASPVSARAPQPRAPGPAGRPPRPPVPRPRDETPAHLSAGRRSPQISRGSRLPEPPQVIPRGRLRRRQRSERPPRARRGRGGGAGPRSPCAAPRRAPGLGGGGRGGVTARAPAAAPARPGLGARARDPAQRERATRAAPPRRRVRAQPPDPRRGGDGTYQYAEGAPCAGPPPVPFLLVYKSSPPVKRVKYLLLFRAGEKDVPQQLPEIATGLHSLSCPFKVPGEAAVERSARVRTSPGAPPTPRP